ncbi:uncharacterized protein LOC110682043 isoform X1 [Chenopodium quinoa]|uniref:uncharacterized protein LOC110682043 isoform X1 n=1 Tax=Chenopodium quinoa TaxID=63459 RepID=UPI000B796CF2|nr:uncharacterized protein LOC110682043 isoform X1 [Chenopodium quinoa]
MGNCANKPLTTEGEAPVEVPETKETTTTTVEDRDIQVDQNKVSSLAQIMLEDDGKKAEAESVVKAVEEKASEPPKVEEVATKEVAVETKKEEAPKPADEPKKEEAKPAASEPKKEEAKPVVVTPAPATAPAPAAAAVPAPAAATAEKK